MTSLDLLLVGFAALNAVLYFGFDNAVMLDHIDAVIYTLLAVQATWTVFRGEPWTTQFIRRTVPPEAWSLPEFRAVNRFSTALWAVCFVACDLAALVLGQPLRLFLPIDKPIASPLAPALGVTRRVEDPS